MPYFVIALGLLLAWATLAPFASDGSFWRSTTSYESLRRIRSINPYALSPLSFERYCADLLLAQGWTVRLTPPSGDFGVDVIAERESRRLVVQVKRWGKPIGLRAVQEVAAGRDYYHAHFAAVVSLSGYKRSAIELARSSRVLLLSHRQLAQINRHLPASSAPAGRP